LRIDNERFKEEAEWVQRVSQGDPDALEKLYEKYFDRVYLYFYDEVRNSTDTEILTTETFRLAVHILLDDHGLWRGKIFGSWLYNIANSVLEEHNRGPLIEDLKHILDRSELAGEGEDDLDLIVKQEEQKMLWELANELQRSEQQVLMLCHRSKLSYREIAIHLGNNEVDCRKLHDQALTNLKRKMQRYSPWSDTRRR
jgi:RNA polymerase sigma factor (sigma-70 family)